MSWPPPRAKLTTRAIAWAVAQLRSHDIAVSSLAEMLGVAWNTVWDAIAPVIQDQVAAKGRLAGVTALGVDEHVWSHVGPPGIGLITGIVDHSRDENGRPRARLLDLVKGRTGAVYADWLAEQGTAFTSGIRTATLDPFHGYANAIRDELPEAITVLDAFHVVKLGGQVVDEVRRRVQQDTLGHRGRAGDPLYGIRRSLQIGAEHLTEKQIRRLNAKLEAGDPHHEVTLAWHCYQKLRAISMPAPRPAAAWSPRSSTRSRPARSPRSPDSDALCGDGDRRSWPTSTRTVPRTGPRKPSTASSKPCGESPAGSATSITTGYEPSWQQAAIALGGRPLPTLKCEGPVKGYTRLNGPTYLPLQPIEKDASRVHPAQDAPSGQEGCRRPGRGGQRRLQCGAAPSEGSVHGQEGVDPPHQLLGMIQRRRG